MRQFGDIQVPRRDGDVAAFSDGFDGVLDDPDDGLLNFCLVELHRVKMLLQLHLPLDSSGLALLKSRRHAPDNRIQISRSMLLVLLLGPAEGRQMVGDLGGTFRSAFDFEK